MREQELANLLIQIGSERGFEMDSLVNELASMKMPSFINERDFRDSLLQAVESQLRLQVDEQIRKMRERFRGESVPQGRVNMPQESSSNRPQQGQVQQGTVNPADLGSVIDSTIIVDDDMPADATMVWDTRKD